jgi:hypothetical protein
MATMEHEWNAPAVEAREEPTVWERLPLERFLLWGWIAFMVSILLFEPAPNPQVHEPAWASALSTAFLGVLLGAGVLAKMAFTRAALGASLLASGFGVGLAIACKTTHHHLGGWWAYELLGSGLMLGLSVVCLARATDRI